LIEIVDTQAVTPGYTGKKGGDKQKPKVAALLKLLSAQQRSLDVSCSRRGLLL